MSYFERASFLHAWKKQIVRKYIDFLCIILYIERHTYIYIDNYIQYVYIFIIINTVFYKFKVYTDIINNSIYMLMYILDYILYIYIYITLFGKILQNFIYYIYYYIIYFVKYKQ